MTYDIGFPVDGGSPEKTFLVKVRLCLAEKHFCTGGKASGLRPKSGAEFVFNRAPVYIQNRYRYEFTPMPMPNPSTRPDTLASSGYSDALACAMALFHRENNTQNTDEILIVLSGSFSWSDESKGMGHLQIERVANDSANGTKSLYNKWLTAKKFQAIAFIVHERDAKILEAAHNIPTIKLKTLLKKDLKNTTDTFLVACGAHQLPLLRSLFGRQGNFLHRAIFLCLTLFLLILLLFFSREQIKTNNNTITQKENNSRYIIETVAQKTTLKNIEQGNWQEVNKILPVIRNGVGVVKVLKECLKSEDWRVWIVTIQIIGRLEKNSKSLIPHIMKSLQSKSSRRLWKYAQHALIHTKPTTAQMLEYTIHKNIRTRKVAAGVVAKIGLDSSISAKSLLKYLKNDLSCEAALNLVCYIKKDTAILLPYIFSLLKKQKYIREKAAETLCALPIDLRSLIYKELENAVINQKILLEILQVISLDSLIDLNRLSKYNQQYPEAIANIVLHTRALERTLNIIYLLENAEALSGWNYVLEYIKMSSEDRNLLPLVIKCLQRKSVQNHDIGKRLISMINEISPSSVEIEKLLYQLLDHPILYKHCCELIVDLKISTPLIVEKLLSKIAIHENCIDFVGVCGDLKVVEAIPVIVPLSEQNDLHIKIPAILALCKIDKNFTNLLYPLIQKIDNYPPKWVGYINLHLAKIQNIEPYVAKTLKTLYKSKDPYIRSTAAVSLFLIYKDLKYLPAILQNNFPRDTYKLISKWSGSPESYLLILRKYSRDPSTYLEIFFQQANIKNDKKAALLRKWMFHRSEVVRLKVLYLLSKYSQSQFFVEYLQKVSIDRNDSIRESIVKCMELKPESYKKALQRVTTFPYYWKYRALARRALQARNNF